MTDHGGIILGCVSSVHRRPTGLPVRELTEHIVVAIDFAKYMPKAMISNFFGEILENSFYLAPNQEGFQLLQSRIEACIERVQAKGVLVGIESTGHTEPYPASPGQGISGLRIHSNRYRTEVGSASIQKRRY